MLEPYSDRLEDGWKGMLLQSEGSFGPLVKKWIDAGWQVVRPLPLLPSSTLPHRGI
jgi:hypothetical protein